MKLNKKTKDEARKMIEEAVKDVPQGQRIHFEKEILEQLLFETEMIKDEYFENSTVYGPAKFVVWSGPVLSKIDLSEVSFDNVCWDAYEYKYVHDDELDKSPLDLSNTNANIDFSKGFKRRGESLCITGFNFEGTDLSNNLINSDCYINNCIFNNTEIKINLNGKNIIMHNSDFVGLDFSEYTVDERFFSDDDDQEQCRAEACNFSNTGLKIKLTDIPSDALSKFQEYKKLSKALEHALIHDFDRYPSIRAQMTKIEEDEYYEMCGARDNMGWEIKNGNLDGCYVNGKIIISKEQRQSSTQEKREEYEKMRNDLLSSINKSIEEQTGKKGRR